MIKKDDFACSCGAEGKTRCAVVTDWALQHYKTTKEKLLTTAVYTLNWDYDAHITGIENDQWSRIDTATYDKSFETHIQCDDLLDGVAFTLKAYFDRYGNVNPSRNGDTLTEEEDEREMDPASKGD